MTAILDPFNHCPGLKILFPEHDYYVFEPTHYLTFTATNHMTNDKFEQMYKFRYLSDWTQITPTRYHTIFIVLPFLDCYPGNWCTKKEAVLMWDIIQNICFGSQQYKKICLFDTYDYDYDPSLLFPAVKIDIYFKRNVSKNKKYNSNVKAFPYMIFLTPCPLYTLLTKKIEKKKDKRNEIFWSGSLYLHDETHQVGGKEERVVRDRETIFNSIKHLLTIYKNLPHDEFIEEMSRCKYALDIQGVGDPNSRTFEIFLSGSLRLFNNNSLTWTFDEGDDFSEYVSFTTGEEFQRNLYILSDINEYNKALEKQNKIVEKYINKEWLRGYINRSINI
jgi:hypothetical protein